MAPTRCKTKHKPGKTKLGEDVLDLAISYIHDIKDRNSVSLVSRKFLEIEGITRKRVTVHTLYSNPSRLSKRFPLIELLTLKGPPSDLSCKTHYHDLRITPWIEQLALEFRCLKELCICGLVVHDGDLKTLARTHGKDLRTLKITKCEGFQADGLMHVSKYCNQLRTLCFKYCNYTIVEDGIWFHELASNSTVLERLHVPRTANIYNAEDVTLLAKNCRNSLISLKLHDGDFYLSKLGDAFKYAVRLEHFSGYNRDAESELVGFQFPPNIRFLSWLEFSGTQYSSVIPFLNQIRKLKFAYKDMDEDSQCLLFKRCPNLEVLYTQDILDKGLQALGQFCKKLRKLVGFGRVTHVGMVALAKGCTSLECLSVVLGEITNEALKCVGTHLKNLRKFQLKLGYDQGATDLPLDNGVRAILMSCSKLESLTIYHRGGGLTDKGLEYIGKYGANLRSLSLNRVENCYAGFVKLSEGCQRLRKIDLWHCPSVEQAVNDIVFNLPCLRYVRVKVIGCPNRTARILTRPEFQL